MPIWARRMSVIVDRLNFIIYYVSFESQIDFALKEFIQFLKVFNEKIEDSVQETMATESKAGY